MGVQIPPPTPRNCHPPTLGRLLLGRDSAVPDVQHRPVHLRSARWTIRSAIVARTDATRFRSRSWARFASVATDLPSSRRSRDSSGALGPFACDPETIAGLKTELSVDGLIAAAAPEVAVGLLVTDALVAGLTVSLLRSYARLRSNPNFVQRVPTAPGPAQSDVWEGSREV